MGRLQQDNSSAVKVSIAQPNAANTVNTNAIDISANAPFPVIEKFTVQVSVSQATGANSKNVNVVLQHTGNVNGNIDSANWANIPQLAQLTASGNSTNIIAISQTYRLPDTVKEFIRASATGEANGGNSSLDGTVTVQLLF